MKSIKGTKIINKKYNICDEEIDVQIRFYLGPSNDLSYVASFLYFTLSNIYKTNNEMDLNIQDIFQKLLNITFLYLDLEILVPILDIIKRKIEKSEKSEKVKK